MVTKPLPLALALGAVASSALAEPVVLTGTQMDRVTAAGGTAVVDAPGFFHLTASTGAATGTVSVQGLQEQFEDWLVSLQQQAEGAVGSVKGTIGRTNIRYQERVVVVAGSGDAKVSQNIKQTSTEGR